PHSQPGGRAPRRLPGRRRAGGARDLLPPRARGRPRPSVEGRGAPAGEGPPGRAAPAALTPRRVSGPWPRRECAMSRGPCLGRTSCVARRKPCGARSLGESLDGGRTDRPPDFERKVIVKCIRADSGLAWHHASSQAPATSRSMISASRAFTLVAIVLGSAACGSSASSGTADGPVSPDGPLSVDGPNRPDAGRPDAAAPDATLVT